MEPTGAPEGPTLDKRALGLARLEASRRRLSLIRRRILSGTALLLIAIWGWTLGQTWKPFAAEPPRAQAEVQAQAEPEERSVVASSVPAPAPAPAPVVSSQS